MNLSVTSSILIASPWNCDSQFQITNTKFSNQARLGQIMFKPMKYLKVRWPVWGLNAGLVETLSLVLRTHVFTSTLLYFHNDVNLLYYHGQGNWLVSSIILAGLFSYWVNLLHCWMWEQTAIASLRYFRETYPWVVNLLNKWLCHLANELTGFIGS